MRPPLLLPLLLASLAPAQSVLIRVQQDNNIGPILNGGTIVVNATGVNQPRTLTVTITYTGATSINFPEPPKILGSTDFSITSPPAAGSLGPNQSLSMQLRYLPANSQATQAQLDFALQEVSVQTPATPANPSPAFIPPRPGLIVLGLNGTVPEYSLNYGLAIDSNIVRLPAGGTLPFIDTIVNSATVATMALVNRGSGAGQLLSVSITGDAFSPLSLPLIPSALPAGSTLQFQVRYRPRQTGTDTGTLTLTFEGGASYTVTLKGRGVTSYLSYELLPPESNAQPISPNQVVTMPATPVGATTTVFVRIRNSSSFDINVSAIAITGAGFQIADLPFVPLTMPPGDVQLFSILFTPSQPARQTGRLRIGGDSFDLAGTGLGQLLAYSYRGPAGLTTVQPLGTVALPAAQIGQSATVDFTLRNNGTAPASVTSATVVADGRSVFTLIGLPALPATIAPNAALTFTVRFSPATSGLASASLRIGADAFTLSGQGNVAAPLPGYTMQGPATVQAFEQPSIGLTLASSYSVNLTGTLTLSTEPDSFASDPSVLFMTGGKVANFTIPAGSTRAVFSNGATELKFQTGSVAGTIIATPAFATDGGQSLTPDAPKLYRAVLAAAAPRLAGLSIDARTTSGFTLQAIGYTTTRTLTKATVSIKGKAGFNFAGTEFTLDLTANSFTWFNSLAAAPFGGQFIVQVPIALTTSDTSTTAIPPIQAIQSITVTLTNERGASNVVTLPLP